MSTGDCVWQQRPSVPDTDRCRDFDIVLLSASLSQVRIKMKSSTQQRARKCASLDNTNTAITSRQAFSRIASLKVGTTRKDFKQC